MSIFQVLSRIKHNSTEYAPGEFLQGEYAEFKNLIGGALRFFEGATSIEEAKSIVANESQATVEAPVPAKPDTWAPSPEKTAAPAAVEAADATNDATAPTAAPETPAADSITVEATAEAAAADTAVNTDTAEQPTAKSDLN